MRQEGRIEFLGCRQTMTASGGGKGLFVIVDKQLGDRDMRGQLQDKIGG